MLKAFLIGLQVLHTMKCKKLQLVLFFALLFQAQTSGSLSMRISGAVYRTIMCLKCNAIVT
jgi:hypothetical protein